MIKDYLYAIGKYLSPSQREDVLKEIQANLFDYLEENYGDKEEYSDEEIEAAILKMGNPKEVAQAYSDRPRALIAPPLLDIYYLLLKIVIPAVSLGLIIANVISIKDNSEVGMTVLKIIGDIWSASLTVIGMMTIIFALLQRYLPDKDLEIKENWTVKNLEKAPDLKEKVSTVESIFGIAFAVLGLLFFNGSGFLIVSDSVNIIPVLNTSVFRNYLPLINISLILSLILHIFLLIKRKWQFITRIVSIILDIFGVVVFGIIAFNPNVFDFTKIPGISYSESLRITEGVQIGMKVGLSVVAIFVAIDIFKHLKLITKKN